MATSVRAKRRQRQQVQGILLILAIGAIVAGMVAFNVYLRRQRPPLDPLSLCPAEGPSGLTVVLVDRSEALNAIQREALRHELDAIKDAVPIRSAIEVYSIGEVGKEVLTPEAPRVCNPGKATQFDPLTSNQRLIDKQWRERFSEPVEKLLQQLLQPRDEPTSPILESIQSVSVTAFARLAGEAPTRRLVIVSDMIQNTAELSHYRTETPFSEFRQTAYYRRVRATLAGVDVSILYVRRDRGWQGKSHVEFWQEYLADCGARLTRVTMAPG